MGRKTMRPEVQATSKMLPAGPSSLALLRTGLHLMQCGKGQAGEQLLERAVKQAAKPESSKEVRAETLSRAALFHQRSTKDFAKAEEMFEDSLKALPSHVPTLVNYAAFRRKIKADLEGAEVLYVKALAIDSTNSQALAGYAHLVSEGHSSPSLAEVFFRRAIKADPRNPQILANYARCMQKQAKHNEAEALYEAALAIDKTCVAAVCNYANFLLRVRQDVSAARGLYEDGLQRNPAHPQLQKNHAFLLKEERSLRAGLNPRCRKLRPKSRQARKMLAGSTIPEADDPRTDEPLDASTRYPPPSQTEVDHASRSQTRVEQDGNPAGRTESKGSVPEG